MHFGHGNIIKYCNRPFLADADRKALEENGGTWHQGNWKGDRSSQWRISREAVEMMDTALINNINAIVGRNDTLWILGDFTFARDFNQIRSYRDRINCQYVNLIWGNHDSDKLRDLFHQTYDLVTIEVPGQRQRITLCHFAMACWDQSHRGSIHLYGHSHGGIEDFMDEIYPGRKSMDVGVDNAIKVVGQYRPFRLEEISNIMEKSSGFTPGSPQVDGPPEEQIC